MKLKQPRRRLSSLLLLTASMLSAFSLSAETFTVGSLIYTSEDNSTASVSGCDKNAVGELIVPESVEYDGLTYSVTDIGNGAFWDCSSLTSVSIPSSVTNISDNAFVNCSGLTTVSISNSVKSIGRCAFYGCKGMTSVSIPSSVTSIGDAAFSGCSSLTSVTIPNSVTYIGEQAFYYCSSLTSVTIPNSVTSIGNGTFYICSSLTSVTIPNSVTSIGNSAFYYCSSLKSVSIPNSVTSIGEYAFYCCGLTSVSIPNSVTNIGNSVFYYCTDLTSVTIPNSVTSIGENAFLFCISLTSVSIPSSVTSIGNGAFSICNSLTSVSIPNSVTSIGEGAFNDCSSLTNIQVEPGNPNYCSLDGVLFNSDKSELITFPAGKSGEYQIPNSVTSIGKEAIGSCNSLTSVTIPSSVTNIGEANFLGCSSLTNIQVESGNPNYCSLDGILFNSDKSELITFPAGKSGEYQIPSFVTNIGDLAFSNCSNLTSVSIPNSITSIGDLAFSNCSNLTSVTIPNSVTNFGLQVFFFCYNLTSVTLPSSITSICNADFLGCGNLQSIYLFGKSTEQLSVESVYTFYDNGYNYDNAVYLVDEITTTQTTAEFDVQKIGLVESFDFEYVDANGVTVKETVNQSGHVSLGNMPADATVTLKVTVNMANGEAYEYRSEITTKDADDQSAIEVVEVEEADGFDVYTPGGDCVRRNATNLNGLRPGIYIANGRKFIVR